MEGPRLCHARNRLGYATALLPSCATTVKASTSPTILGSPKARFTTSYARPKSIAGVGPAPPVAMPGRSGQYDAESDDSSKGPRSFVARYRGSLFSEESPRMSVPGHRPPCQRMGPRRNLMSPLWRITAGLMPLPQAPDERYRAAAAGSHRFHPGNPNSVSRDLLMSPDPR